ncbi:MAG TPA: hypothetical protein VIE36_22175 [Methylomirabilota bacterium]|jgi:hypothetical protein
MRRRAAFVAGPLVVVSLLTGCATRTVDVGYPEADTKKALLASVAPRRVTVAPVTDRRGDKDRIGASPKDGKAIVTERPVADIVRDALVLEVAKNGHQVVAAPADVVVAADVEEFWLDAVGRSPSTQYVGRVAIAVIITDGQTGDRLWNRRYVGIRRRTAEADSKTAWREVMEVALARTIRDVATDPDLALSIARSHR